ncbi:hypothetical protein C1637_18090 [Chryseobacterium lactis]|uniref:DUF4349 domain-containing protein n=1 Tax=Chryseobacterium lactis TaxID=1241981 RepID=A0A3G6RGD8_CHRLC|nr:DUF4349 domain-containing protein [Chryseobacterium lactis]AZA82856.1 DUF4349 domain-containing protein [Chryseobacterium lactis]AZB03238.1 DUF4349 domain-containing protein [Chryseobacterium lactis]PNW12476.1 hypothetical protein C1637_18090 [Chryseobacterium lactis]
MKKFILLVAVSSTFIMCKKGGVSQSKAEEALHTIDSTATIATDAIDNAGATVDKALDSANIKVKDFENTKNDIREKIQNTSKIVDSLTDKIASTKLESKVEKKDSTKKAEKIIVNVPAPKVIKETKVVYKEKPKNDSYELNRSKDRMVKSGQISIKADNAETVKEIIKEEAIKNNGYIKSEDLSYIESADRRREDQKVYSIDIKVPIQNFDYLMNALSDNIGDIESKNIQVSGNNYTDNTICSISVSLTDKADIEKQPTTFGEKSFAAVSSGWEVITSIFLFILPLWPLFLIGGIGYYFYKKKSKNVSDKGSDQI